MPLVSRILIGLLFQEVTLLHKNVNIALEMAATGGRFSGIFKKLTGNVVGMIHLQGSPGRQKSTKGLPSLENGN